jgi:hypothetical protein
MTAFQSCNPIITFKKQLAVCRRIGKALLSSALDAIRTGKTTWLARIP